MSVTEYRSVTADSYMDDGNAATNYGTSTVLLIGDTGAKGAVRRTLLRFDISMIPAGATINSAQLRLYCSTAASAGVTSYVVRIVRDWVEGQVTWTVYTTGNNWTTAGASHDGNDQNTTDPARVSWNMPTGTGEFAITGLAAMAQDALDDESGSFDVMLHSGGEAGNVNCVVSSSEHATEENHPELEIVWTPASGEATKVYLTKDTYIFQQFPDANYDGSSILVSVGAGPNIRRALIEVDLSSIRGVLAEARLVMFSGPSSITDDYTAYRVKRTDVVEAQATWNIYKTGSNWQTAGCSGANDYDSTMSAASAVRHAAGEWFDALNAASLLTLAQDAVTQRAGALILTLRKDDEGTVETALIAEDDETPLARKRPYMILRWTKRRVMVG